MDYKKGVLFDAEFIDFDVRRCMSYVPIMINNLTLV